MVSQIRPRDKYLQTDFKKECRSLLSRPSLLLSSRSRNPRGQRTYGQRLYTVGKLKSLLCFFFVWCVAKTERALLSQLHVETSPCLCESGNMLRKFVFDSTWPKLTKG